MERMCEQVATQSAKLEKRFQRASRRDKIINRSLDIRSPNEDSNSSGSEEFHDAESVFRIPPYVKIYLKIIFPLYHNVLLTFTYTLIDFNHIQ